MDWLSLPVNVLLGPEHLKVPKNARAVWLSLLAHCAFRENGGVISDASSWTKRDWDRLAGTSRHEVETVVSAGLAAWNGPDLVVHHYPVKPERVLQRKREGGEEGGIRSGEARKSQASPPRTPSKPLAPEVRRTPLNGEESVGEERRGEEVAQFALTPSEPPVKSSVTDLRAAWIAWFRERYHEEYSWTGRDGSDAAEVLRMANGRGVDEVMRRARALGGQKREKAITVAIVRMAWNEVTARPVSTPQKSDPLLDGIADGTYR